MAKVRVIEKTLMWVEGVYRLAEPGEIVEYEGEIASNLERVDEGDQPAQQPGVQLPA